MRYILADDNENLKLLTTDKKLLLHGLLSQEPGEYLLSVIPDRPTTHAAPRRRSKLITAIRKFKHWNTVADAICVVMMFVMCIGLYFVLCMIR